jgi:nucleoside-diphosphate-sugar epimerase
VREDDPLRDWTFAPDLAGALERLVGDPPALRPVHLGSPYIYRDSEVATAIASHFPGATIVTGPPGDPVKPPMIPSALPALARFPWTDLHTGVGRILQVEPVRL